MRIPFKHFPNGSIVIAGLICSLGLGFLAAPSKSAARIEAALPADAGPTIGARHAVPLRVTNPLRTGFATAAFHSVYVIPDALRLNAAQDAGQASPPAAAPAPPKPVELPEGEGKPIATEFCQDCHRLTNLTKAHKNLDDWKDTIHTMIDRGARIPDEKIDLLAQYLAANFGPKDAAAPAPNGPAVPASSSPSPSSPAATAPGAPEPVKAVVELPEGEGKAIATENCQACHKLTNLTKAHKNLDDWKDTVQTMIDRGANVPADKVDILVQYLAKNFGPKDAASPAATPAR